uniref:Uncharacterized protein n=1 Tax=Magallana gigas TaxID=29159 RepID=A0A8W8LPL9_MAGGI
MIRSVAFVLVVLVIGNLGFSINDNTRQEREQCPHPCLAGGQTYCHPVPCPFPPCDNPVTSPGDCCPHCPTGTV